ncbi:MAG: sulfite exporter TauE/SafE family protein [Sphaerochaetaceae bacterium]|nr:sulfite exporter TauE/SafE family protein [Sphaerochaetaceae bacterium]
MNAMLCLVVMVLLGSVAQSSIGFGMAIVMMMGLSGSFPFGTAVALTQVTGALNSWYISIKLRHKVRWKVLACISLPSLAVGMICTRCSASLATGKLMIALGMVFVLLSLYFLVFSQRIHLQPTVASGLAMGVVTGLGNGFFGIGGPPTALYLVPALPDKEEYLATIQASFALSSTCNFLIRIWSGQVPASLVPMIWVGWAASIVGTLAGLWLFRHLRLEVLRKVVYACVGLDGIWIILQHVGG